MREILFSKYSIERSPQFAIRTSIVQDEAHKWVEKTPMTQEAAAHVEKLASSYKALCRTYAGTRIRPCPVVVENGVAKFEFLQGEFFNEKLGRLIEKKDEVGILTLCKEYVSIVKSGAEVKKFQKTPEFVRIFGDIDLPDNLTATSFSNVDWIFENLVEVKNGNIVLIDYEWCFDFPVPLEYILYRSFYITFMRWGMQSFVDQTLCPELRISPELISVLWQIETGFTRYVEQGECFNTAWHTYAPVLQRRYDWRGELEQKRQEWERQKEELLRQQKESEQQLIRQREELIIQYEETKQQLMCQHEKTKQQLLHQQNELKQQLIRQKEELISQKEESERELIHQREELIQQLVQVQNAYNAISNAFFWKITKPVRAIVSTLRGIKRSELKIDERSNTDYLEPIPQEAIDQVLKHTIDIIIPVFNGFSYLERLLASIEQTEIPYQLILIEDKSTDHRILPFLKDYAAQRSNVTLIENKRNLGFVQSVNLGLCHSENHVAIVNTDVIVPQGWLERLMLPIVAGQKVASSTPFTNSGTICSFPNFCENNGLFLGLDVQQIDAEFAKITPKYPIIPTGVGFCMGMSRKALDMIGLLDAETFGKGYGEENDWCRRASEAGFVNVHTDNLFVYHQHGASFPSEEKQALLKKNGEALLKKYPDYDRLVAEYCRKDPCAPIREYVKEQLMRGDEEHYTVLTFNHSWGGGASAYLLRECRHLLQSRKRVVQVEYQSNNRTYSIKYLQKDEDLEKSASIKNFSALCKMLPERIDEIWINELVSYPELYQTLADIPLLAKNHGARLLFLLHDYFALCPTINLLNTRGEYCKLPDRQNCEKCLQNNSHFQNIHRAERKKGTEVWQKHWLEFLKQCDEVRTFSNASKELLVQVFTELPEENITVHPHQIDYLPMINDKKKRTNTLNIGVIGAISENKGIYIVKELADIIKYEGLNINIIIIGITHPEIVSDCCHTTGKYERQMLPYLMLKYDIDLVLIPSIWPETFSYTTEEAMTMGLPVACFDMGAPAERVSKYEKGLLLPQLNAQSILKKIREYAKNNLPPYPNRQRTVLFVVEENDYAAEYRTEHFREELLFCGIGSDFVLISEVSHLDISLYDAVVVYRCSSIHELNYLQEETKRTGIKIFFDIDAPIFDSNSILQANLSEKDRQQYLSKMNSYRANMEKADGLIVSTEVLAQQIKLLFPNKPVCIHRSAINLEMETVLVGAGQNSGEVKDDTIYLVYFGDPQFNDICFSEIVEPLSHIFQKYLKVKLQVYGQLNIPSPLECYCSRIEQYEAIEDWRNLSKKISQEQIYLLPSANTLFDICKLENKWMEASLAGGVTVMSSISELEQVIENGETGFLCKTPQEWEEVLSLLIKSADQRNRVATNAQTEVLKKHLTRNSEKSVVKFIF